MQFFKENDIELSPYYYNESLVVRLRHFLYKQSFELLSILFLFC